QVVAHAKAQGQARQDLPVILHEGAERFHAYFAARIADEDSAAGAATDESAGSASQEVFQGRVADLSAPEAYTALAVAVAKIVGAPVTELAAEADSVLVMRPGDVVDELPRLVGRGVQRPAVIASEGCETVDGDLRHAEVHRIGDAGVDA